MRDPRRLPRRDRKAGRDGCDHHCDRKEFLPPQQNRNCGERNRYGGGDRKHRLVIGGKVKGNAGPERHRHPRQQAPSSGFRARPCAQRFDQRRPESRARWHQPANRRGRARRPGSGVAPLPAQRVALLRHPDLHLTILSRPQDYRTLHSDRYENGCRNLKKRDATAWDLPKWLAPKKANHPRGKLLISQPNCIFRLGKACSFSKIRGWLRSTT